MIEEYILNILLYPKTEPITHDCIYNCKVNNIYMIQKTAFSVLI